MSIISDLKTKVTGAPTPADINFMLSQAQDVLDHLQDDYANFFYGARRGSYRVAPTPGHPPSPPDSLPAQPVEHLACRRTVSRQP